MDKPKRARKRHSMTSLEFMNPQEERVHKLAVRILHDRQIKWRDWIRTLELSLISSVVDKYTTDDEHVCVCMHCHMAMD